MTKQCQSCGMPLKKESDKGTEADGSLSETYCAMCYQNGAFTDPNATPQQMQEIANQALRDKHVPGLLRKLAMRQIPKLARWEHKP